MAGPQLASSIISRTPDQATVVEDVYKKTDSTVVNSYQDATGTSQELYDQFGFLNQYISGNKIGSGSFDATLPSASSTINNALPDSAGKQKSALSNLADSASSIFKTIGTSKNGITALIRQGTSLYAQVNGVAKSIKSGNLKDLRSVTNAINSITNTTSVILSPTASLGKMYGASVSQANAAGISDAFGAVAKSIKENNDIVNKGSLLYQMASTSLPSALARGDVSAVSNMTDHLGSGVLGILNPSAVSQLAKNNRTTYSTNQILGSSGQYNTYQTTFSKVDAGWNVSSWKPANNDATITDLSCLMSASNETKNVFSTGAKASDNDTEKLYNAATLFGDVKTVDGELSERYPYVPLVSNQTTLGTGT